MIEVKTRYTEDSILNYFHIIGKINAKTLILYIIILLVLSIAIHFLMSLGNLKFLLTMAIFCLICIILSMSSFWPKTKTKNLIKSIPVLFETEYVFVFYDEYFVVNFSDNLVNGTSEIKYDALVSVFEVNCCFYFQGINGFYIIDKKDFTQGTPDELSILLESILPNNKFKKYIR